MMQHTGVYRITEVETVREGGKEVWRTYGGKERQRQRGIGRWSCVGREGGERGRKGWEGGEAGSLVARSCGMR